MCLLIEYMKKKIIQGKMVFYCYCVILSNPPTQGVIYITKLEKKIPGLIITFKIESGNQPLVTEDYKLLFQKANLEFSSEVTLKNCTVLFSHTKTNVFLASKKVAPELIHNSNAVNSGYTKVVAFKVRKIKDRCVCIVSTDKLPVWFLHSLFHFVKTKTAIGNPK